MFANKTFVHIGGQLRLVSINIRMALAQSLLYRRSLDLSSWAKAESKAIGSWDSIWILSTWAGSRQRSSRTHSVWHSHLRLH